VGQEKWVKISLSLYIKNSTRICNDFNNV